MATFIEINADIFNVDKIQAIIRRDEKNRLGYDNGVYLLEIHMEGGIGSMSKAYSSKKFRDDDFVKARKQLMGNSRTKKEPQTEATVRDSSN
ncbi:hypothetical protein [Enterocloster lavalensis]|jgi:hypothetical protein|uniref:hypothetical protein n=1 Tax=Enterocloster lavalensis TaxID=460384 RepID=UPI000D1ACEA7|nr:hypothetical protein [Enterocloster lavalensis]MBS5606299.1 hypothetical protein [Enterocloster asparagiformis]PST30318.1 hypothetical protein C7256_25800 [Enterocloster lavalensis]DAN57354.1 MAG TPA: hypothetical protein [Caudoviricetes sp.]